MGVEGGGIWGKGLREGEGAVGPAGAVRKEGQSSHVRVAGAVPEGGGGYVRAARRGLIARQRRRGVGGAGGPVFFPPSSISHPPHPTPTTTITTRTPSTLEATPRPCFAVQSMPALESPFPPTLHPRSWCALQRLPSLAHTHNPNQPPLFRFLFVPSADCASPLPRSPTPVFFLLPLQIVHELLDALMHLWPRRPAPTNVNLEAEIRQQASRKRMHTRGGSVR